VRSVLSGSLLALALVGATACAVAGQGAPSARAWLVPLTPSDGSAVSGQAIIHENGPDQWMVMVVLQGLEPNSHRAVQVHNGSCSGAILYPLEAMVADANGTGYSNTNLVATPDATWWIRVSRADSPSESTVVCGQVPAS
jgi:hypothetical protein